MILLVNEVAFLKYIDLHSSWSSGMGWIQIESLVFAITRFKPDCCAPLDRASTMSCFEWSTQSGELVVSSFHHVNHGEEVPLVGELELMCE